MADADAATGGFVPLTSAQSAQRPRGRLATTDQVIRSNRQPIIAISTIQRASRPISFPTSISAHLLPSPRPRTHRPSLHSTPLKILEHELEAPDTKETSAVGSQDDCSRPSSPTNGMLKNGEV
jgi:hypothetical protein